MPASLISSGWKGQGKKTSVLSHTPSPSISHPACDRWLRLQHVRHEPGPLSALSRLQAEGPPGSATLGSLHFKGGREESQP